MQALMTRFATPLLFPLALLLGAPVAVAAPAATHPAAVARGIGSAPAALVTAIARTQAQDAAQNSAYAIGNNGCATLPAGAQGAPLAGCFAKTGPAFSTGKQTIHLQLSAWGRVGHLRPVTLTRTAPQANRIAYRGPHIAEWWRVLPLGYEQGFTIEQAPAGSGKVVLQLSASTAPTVTHGTLAWGKLRYGKLHVVDASGKVLPATLSARGKTIALAFDAAHARYPVSIDPLVWVQQEVTASNGAASDAFGDSVALSFFGNTALVGADDKTVGGNSQQGAAYVYTLANGIWSQAAELTAADGAANDHFGNSVVLSSHGKIALVGSYTKIVNGHNYQGAAYVFTTTDNWTTHTQAELTASNGAANDLFGSSVALDLYGDTALVGADGKTVGGNTQQGAAYWYTEPTGGWATTSADAAELTASDGAANDYFGESVALSGDGSVRLVGAEGKTVGSNSAQGAAYVYANSTFPVELTAANGAANDHFGSSVALSLYGATALVGAKAKTVGGNSAQGAAYVLTTTDNWATSAQTELTAANGAANDYFGESVALSSNGGTTALVGALYKTIGGNSAQGAAYVLTTTDNWTTSAQTELTASNGAANDSFGYSVALSSNGTTALVGAKAKTVGGNTQQGAAYFFGDSDLSAVLSALTTAQTNTQFPSQYILTNASATASAALVVSLPLPATNAGYVSVIASQGTCSYDSTAKVATCAVGSIPGNGGTASASFTLKATGALGSTIAQSAQLANGAPNLAQTASTTIVPPPPTLSGLSNVTVTAPTAGTETFTLAGTGTLTVTATSSNTALLPAADITGASSCTAAGSCTLTLTPATGQIGSATVTVTVTDSYSQSGTGSFTFTANKPAAPTASGLSNVTVTAPTAGSEAFTLTGAGTLTVTATSSNTALLPAADISGASSCTAAGSCTLTLTPATGQIGSATVTVTVTDSYNQSGTGSFTFTANKPAAPTASGLSNVTVTAPTAGSEIFKLTGTGTLTLTATSSNTALLPDADITGASSCTAAGSCTLTLTPVGGQTGSTAVIVTVTDAYNQSATGAFTFTVQPPPTAPTANSLSLTTYENSAISANLSAGAPNGDALSYAIAAQPTHGAVTVNAGTGAFTYTPTSGYSGSDSFTFTAKDTVIGLSSNTATVSITVNATPPPGQIPPVASNLTLTTYTGQALSDTLPAVVTPSSDALSYAIAAQPTHGAVTVSATTGAFTYTPASGYNGSDPFTFTAKDTVTGLVSNTATVSITVNAVPPPGQVPPVASNLTLTTYTGQALAGTLSAVVTPNSDTLIYAIAAQPTHGTVTANTTTGAFTYTPTSGYSGSDSFTFTAKDTVTGLSPNTATVAITIKATPSAGGGALGPWSLAALLGLALLIEGRRRRQSQA